MIDFQLECGPVQVTPEEQDGLAVLTCLCHCGKMWGRIVKAAGPGLLAAQVDNLKRSMQMHHRALDTDASRNEVSHPVL